MYLSRFYALFPILLWGTSSIGVIEEFPKRIGEN